MNIRILTGSLLLIGAIAAPPAHAQAVPTGNPLTCGIEFAKCVATTGNWLTCGIGYKRCIDTPSMTPVSLPVTVD